MGHVLQSAASRQWTLAFQAEYESRLAAWSDVQGHLEFLHAEVAKRPGCQVLELGTRTGVSTAALLAGAERSGGHVWSVDLIPPRVPSWWQLTGRWMLVVGDDLDPEVQAALPGQADVVFLDTSHEHEHTLAELRAYVPRVAPGGVLLAHDTDLAGHDARGFGLEGPDGPVRRALDAFCAEAGLAWSNRPGSFGLGVIEIPKEP